MIYDGEPFHQLRHWNVVKAEVINRSALILDIFASMPSEEKRGSTGPAGPTAPAPGSAGRCSPPAAGSGRAHRRQAADEDRRQPRSGRAAGPASAPDRSIWVGQQVQQHQRHNSRPSRSPSRASPTRQIPGLSPLTQAKILINDSLLTTLNHPSTSPDHSSHRFTLTDAIGSVTTSAPADQASRPP